MTANRDIEDIKIGKIFNYNNIRYILFISIIFYTFGKNNGASFESYAFGFCNASCLFIISNEKDMSKDKLPFYDIILAIIGAAAWSYIVVNFESLVRRAGIYTTLDIFVGIVGILILFEACRRIVGLPILIISLIFIIYALFGAYAPGFLNHRGYSYQRLVSHLFYNTEGIMGTPIGASTTFIFLFIFFGALLDKTGIGQFL